MRVLIRVVGLIAAIIFIQTLYFKFTGAPESIYIFETLGMEPWGRYASGIAELIASVLILIPKTTKYGALIGIAIMIGAIASHLTILGIEVQGDGGLLFGLAVVELVCCTLLLYLSRKPSGPRIED